MFYWEQDQHELFLKYHGSITNLLVIYARYKFRNLLLDRLQTFCPFSTKQIVITCLEEFIRNIQRKYRNPWFNYKFESMMFDSLLMTALWWIEDIAKRYTQNWRINYCRKNRIGEDLLIISEISYEDNGINEGEAK